MTPRLTRRELLIFSGGVARRDGMMEPLAELLCYRCGTCRASEAGEGTIRAVARKWGVPRSTLAYNARVATERIVRTFRSANNEGSRLRRP